MSESRKRLLSQLSSSIFTFDRPNTIAPVRKTLNRNSSFTSPKLNLNQVSVNPKIDIRPSISTRSLSNREMITPRQRKQIDLNSYTTENFPKPEEAKVETIQISGLRPYDNESVLKGLAQKYHVIQVNTEFDNVKGICTGQGKIVIRSFQSQRDKEELVLKLRNNGFDVRDSAKIVPKSRISNVFATFDSSLRSSRGLERSHFSNENTSRNLTPRYMQATASYSRKYL